MTVQPISDERIVSEFFARDENAILHAKKRYGSFVFSVCYRVLRKKPESEECQNEAFLRAWNSIPPAKPDNLRAYLAKLARASAVDYARKWFGTNGEGITRSLDDLSDLFADEKTPDDALSESELCAVLDRFLSSLSKEDRAVFVKRYYFGEKIREIVAETGIPRSTVFRNLSAMKDKLKDILCKEGYIHD